MGPRHLPPDPNQTIKSRPPQYSRDLLQHVIVRVVDRCDIFRVEYN